jgi:hypothetical protein
VKKSTAQFTYTEEWSKTGRNIQRRTEIRSSVASRVCSPAQIDEVDTASRALQKRTDPVVYYAQAAPTASRPNLMQQFFGGGQQPAARAAQTAR